jgi:diketogulonate reductase-like aldo/keto reductase
MTYEVSQAVEGWYVQSGAVDRVTLTTVAALLKKSEAEVLEWVINEGLTAIVKSTTKAYQDELAKIAAMFNPLIEYLTAKTQAPKV